MQARLSPTLILAILVAGNLLAAGQPAGTTARKKSDCSGAWTGVVTYARTQSHTESRTTERVSGRGSDTRTTEMTYNYKATISVFEAPEKDGTSVAKASITHHASSKDTTVAIERNSCDRGKTWQDMMGTFTSDITVTGEGSEAANVQVGVATDGTYTVRVSIPRIQGKTTATQTATYSGQCRPKEGKNLTTPATETTIGGNSLGSDGSHRIDPHEPDRLSGSYTLPLGEDGSETITWNLQRCAAPLRIIDLKFEHMKFPNWDDWQAIDDITGTVDGNWVKIKARVFNGHGTTKTGTVYFKETYQGDRWDGARPDMPLKDQAFTVTLESGEEREVEMLWDSSGYAWFDDGRPRYLQRIKAEVWEFDRKVDEMTRNLKFSPRPLVIVPGAKTSTDAIAIYQNLLTTAHSYGWKACGVVDASRHGTIGGEGTTRTEPGSRSVYDHADNLTTYTNAIRAEMNAWHIDMLAHSTGGLVARLYVHKQMDVLPDGYPVVKHLMLMGTPNAGVPCADSVVYRELFGYDRRTAEEILPEEIARFNQFVTQRKGTRFSALAGNAVPLLCGRPTWNDGLVSVESAGHGIEDVSLTEAMHWDMFNTVNFSEYVLAHVVVGPRGTYPRADRARR